MSQGRRTYNDITDEILLLRAENERLRTLAVETDRALEYCLTGVTIERCPSPGLLETTLGILRKTVASLNPEGAEE